MSLSTLPLDICYTLLSHLALTSTTNITDLISLSQTSHNLLHAFTSHPSLIHSALVSITGRHSDHILQFVCRGLTHSHGAGVSETAIYRRAVKFDQTVLRFIRFQRTHIAAGAAFGGKASLAYIASSSYSQDRWRGGVYAMAAAEFPDDFYGLVKGAERARAQGHRRYKEFEELRKAFGTGLLEYAREATLTTQNAGGVV